MHDQVDDAADAYEGMCRLIQIATDQPELDNDGLEEVLVLQGVDRKLAGRLVLFVPVAFGRIITDAYGLRPNPEYNVELEDQSLVGPFRYVDRIEFRVASQHADHLCVLPGFQNLAERSGEVNLLRKLLGAGSDPTQCTVGQAVVLSGYLDYLSLPSKPVGKTGGKRHRNYLNKLRGRIGKRATG